MAGRIGRGGGVASGSGAGIDTTHLSAYGANKHVPAGPVRSFGDRAPAPCSSAPTIRLAGGAHSFTRLAL